MYNERTSSYSVEACAFIQKQELSSVYLNASLFSKLVSHTIFLSLTRKGQCIHKIRLYAHILRQMHVLMIPYSHTCRIKINDLPQSRLLSNMKANTNV